MCIEGNTEGKVLASFDLEEFAEKIREEAIEEFSQIIAMDIADCSKCPLDCKVNTYGGCEEMLKTYVLEQLKEKEQ